MLRIIVAEDDTLSRKLLKTILEQMGFAVDAFEDGQKAWEAYEKTPAAIVVSDWRMPLMDGLTFVRKIRARKSQDYTYFIILTANVQTEENYHAAMEAGVDDFLEKPLDRDRLWSRLRVAQRILSYTKQIGQLESMLPICSYCKKIREGKDYWQQIEAYISDHTGASFSHSICPDCYEKVVKPQLDNLK